MLKCMYKLHHSRCYRLPLKYMYIKLMYSPNGKGKHDTPLSNCREHSWKIRESYHTPGNCFYITNTDSIFEIVVVYIWKSALTLNLQTVTPTFDAIFEFLGSTQHGKKYSLDTFITYSGSYKIKNVRSLSISFEK